MVKNCFYTLLLSLVSYASIAQIQSHLVDKVIAKVGSEFVLLSDVETEYAYSLTRDPSITEDTKCGILDGLIAQKLIIYQAKLDSVQVQDAEVEAQLNLRFDNILRQMNGDQQIFKEYYGASVVEMKERFRDDQRQQIIAERMQGQLINSVTITPEEVKEFFYSIPTDSLPYLDSEVELAEIVVKPTANKMQKDIAKEKLERIREKIVSGEKSFEELALSYSMDPGSAAKGGDLGWAGRGTYVPEFEAALFTLKENEISDIIETQFGYHIMKMLERRGNQIRGRHILIKPDIVDSDNEKVRTLLDSVKNLIEIDSISFEAAVKRFSNEDSQSFTNNGRLKNPSTGNNFFRTEELEYDMYIEIIDMEPNELSNVLEGKDYTGETQYRILKLISITEPHQASLEQDYDKISRFAKESKKSEYFANWVKEKMSATFIEVNSIYSSCPNVAEYVKETEKP